MDFINKLAESYNIESNTVFISLLVAAIALVSIFVLIVVMIIVSIRNKAKKRQNLNYYRQKGTMETPRQPQPSPAPMTPPAPFAPPAPHVPPAQPFVPMQPSAPEQPMTYGQVPVPPQVPTPPLGPAPAPAPAPEPVKMDSQPAVSPLPGVISESVNSQPARSFENETETELLGAVVDNIADNRSKKADKAKKKVGKKSPLKEGKNKKRAAKALKKRAKKLVIPKSVQDTIPYVRVYPKSGIIETADGQFCKSYLLDDVNYSVAKEEEQETMFLKYAEFMNAFDTTCKFQITINQKNMNIDAFEADTMLPMENDGLDHLRTERNDMLREKIREGKNELTKEKYLTVSAAAPDYDSALTVFARLESEIIENIKKIGGAVAHPLNTSQRLEILHDIYNPDDVGMFGNNMKRDANGNLVFDKDKFRFDIMRRMGLSTKDMIGPESFTFKSDYGMVGDKYFRALFMRTLPQSVKDDFLKDLTDKNANMITSLIYQPIDGQSAIKMARQDIRNVNANVMDKQKKASKEGYDPALINPDLRDAAEEAEALRDDLTHKNQKLFYLTLVIVHFADSKEQLDSDTKSIQAIGQRVSIGIKKLSYQQENGLASVLPLCNNKLQIKRSLTSEGSAVFMPFVNQELNDRNGGMYYGNNAVSGNLILHNRRNSKNGNGFIFGQPGSGKSMAGKQEMANVLMSNNRDEVVVIDPEAEYYPMAEMLGGEVIRIAPGNGVHINPFDIDLNSKYDEDPITMKADFICSICETIMGERYGLTPGQLSLIDRCVKRVYQPYLDSMDRNTGLYDKNKLPTLKTFYDELRNEIGFDAKNLADAMEIYVTGSQNLFAFHTNVEYTKRFVVYDISKIGNSMKSLGLLVVLDNIWNRIVTCRGTDKYLWFYIDEIYLLFKNESSAEFLRNLYKRARKYNGIPTGITQNITDLLENPTARSMVANSEFIQMLSQSLQDRSLLGELLNISPTQMSYITNSSPGHGLLYDGIHLVPFINKLPRDTLLYEAMTTKPSEVKERENRKKAEEEAREAELAKMGSNFEGVPAS